MSKVRDDDPVVMVLGVIQRGEAKDKILYFFSDLVFNFKD